MRDCDREIRAAMFGVLRQLNVIYDH